MRREYSIRCPRCGHDNRRATVRCWSPLACPGTAVMAGSVACGGCWEIFDFKISYVPADGDPEV